MKTYYYFLVCTNLPFQIISHWFSRVICLLFTVFYFSSDSYQVENTGRFQLFLQSNAQFSFIKKVPSNCGRDVVQSLFLFLPLTTVMVSRPDRFQQLLQRTIQALFHLSFMKTFPLLRRMSFKVYFSFQLERPTCSANQRDLNFYKVSFLTSFIKIKRGWGEDIV